ncbi:MAG: RNA-binding domain-containing protein [Candidatus Thorarchaeota archaeon]
MKKMKSATVDKSKLDRLTKEILSHKNADILECTNEWELTRARIDGNLIVVYSSGKISYQSSIVIDKILNKYGVSKVDSKKSSGKKKDLKPIKTKLNETQKQHLIETLSQIAEEGTTPGEYEEATFLLDGAKITIYTTGTVYSPHGHTKFEEALVKAIGQNPSHPEYEIVIGQDEVGKGEIFGPMIAGSVAVTQEEASALQFAGVRDSKSLAKERIAELSKIIGSKAIAKKTISIGARRFNEMFREFKDESQTLNDMLAWAHMTALKEVLEQLDSMGKGNSKILVIIDEFGRISTDKKLSEVIKKRDIKVIQEPRAEDLSAAVASASILAKSIRNTEMDKLAKEIGVPLDKRNISEILRHPKGHDAIRLVYLDGADVEFSINNTREGESADKEIESILRKARLESRDIDFKSIFPDNATNIGKVIAAMANCNGGVIYFGIHQKANEIKIIGLEDYQKTEERASGQAKLADPVPFIEYTLLITSEKKNILKVLIPMSHKIVRFSGKYYKRVGSTTEEMTTYEIDNWPSSCRNTDRMF